MRQASASPDSFVAAFVDQGRDDYTVLMNLIFSEEELNADRITGEDVVKRYLERLPATEPYEEAPPSKGE